MPLIKHPLRLRLRSRYGLISGSPYQTGNWSQKILQAADDLKRAQVKILCVKLGNAGNQDFAAIASSNSLVFRESDIDGLSGTLLDTSAEICGNGTQEDCLVTLIDFSLSL